VDTYSGRFPAIFKLEASTGPLGLSRKVPDAEGYSYNCLLKEVRGYAVDRFANALKGSGRIECFLYEDYSIVAEG
jgi:hypothetical protein